MHIRFTSADVRASRCSCWQRRRRFQFRQLCHKRFNQSISPSWRSGLEQAEGSLDEWFFAYGYGSTVTDETYQGKAAKKIAVDSFWGANYILNGWQTLDISPYENGTLEFDAVGAVGSETFSVGFVDVVTERLVDGEFFTDNDDCLRWNCCPLRRVQPSTARNPWYKKPNSAHSIRNSCCWPKKPRIWSLLFIRLNIEPQIVQGMLRIHLSLLRFPMTSLEINKLVQQLEKLDFKKMLL